MNGDFSRWTATHAIATGYAAVLMQQARLFTDADWNEAFTLAAHRTETSLGALIGLAGTPKGQRGFQIGADASGFSIRRGRYYLDGAMIEVRESTTYDAQGGPVSAEDISTLEAGEVLVYVEATRPVVTAQEDSRLADAALGGVDTSVRVKAAWRVGVQPVDLGAEERAALIEDAHCGGLPDLPGWGPSTGRLRAGLAPEEEAENDCMLAPEAGYLSQENQLYRVQIVRGGSRAQARYVWSRENASVQAILARNGDGDFVLRGARDDDVLGFAANGWVEVSSEADRFLGRTGRLVRMTWSDGFASFTPGIGDFDDLVAPRVRRWDHGGNSDLGLQLPLTPTTIERGIQLSFANGTYQEGDFWMFEARAALGGILWGPVGAEDASDGVPPMGWARRRAPLALGRWTGELLEDITDLRAEFPTLTCLHAEDVEFDDTACNLGANTVQDALEALCQRTSSGLCTVVVRTAQELQTAIQALPRRASARICLRSGIFALNETLMVRDLGHVTFEGVGPSSVVSTASGESAVAFINCASVRVTDLSVNGGPTGVRDAEEQDGRRGALSMINCGDVSVERVRARCRSGLQRSAACISTRGQRGASQVRVRDCHMRVGQAQIGVQIIGATRALVENCTIRPIAMRNVLGRVLADPVLVSRAARALLSFPGGARSLGSLSLIDGGGETQTAQVINFATSKRNILFAPRDGSPSVRVNTDASIIANITNAIGRTRGHRIAAQPEMRRHLTNLIEKAVREGGSTRIGTSNRRIIPQDLLNLSRVSSMAEGVVIAGSSVEEAVVTGNRIEGANDCIRIAASGSGDQNPPSWSSTRPPNTVARALVQGNVLGVMPVSAETGGYGIYLGHTHNGSISDNDISVSIPGEPDMARSLPLFGVYQFGYRGPRLTISQNSVEGGFFGYAVIPSISDQRRGIWRLRDNATAGLIMPYAITSNVEVI